MHFCVRVYLLRVTCGGSRGYFIVQVGVCVVLKTRVFLLQRGDSRSPNRNRGRHSRSRSPVEYQFLPSHVQVGERSSRDRFIDRHVSRDVIILTPEREYSNQNRDSQPRQQVYFRNRSPSCDRMDSFSKDYSETRRVYTTNDLERFSPSPARNPGFATGFANSEDGRFESPRAGRMMSNRSLSPEERDFRRFRPSPSARHSRSPSPYSANSRYAERRGSRGSGPPNARGHSPDPPHRNRSPSFDGYPSGQGQSRRAPESPRAFSPNQQRDRRGVSPPGIGRINDRSYKRSDQLSSWEEPSPPNKRRQSPLGQRSFDNDWEVAERNVERYRSRPSPNSQQVLTFTRKSLSLSPSANVDHSDRDRVVSIPQIRRSREKRSSSSDRNIQISINKSLAELQEESEARRHRRERSKTPIRLRTVREKIKARKESQDGKGDSGDLPEAAFGRHAPNLLGEGSRRALHQEAVGITLSKKDKGTKKSIFDGSTLPDTSNSGTSRVDQEFSSEGASVALSHKNTKQNEAQFSMTAQDTSHKSSNPSASKDSQEVHAEESDHCQLDREIVGGNATVVLTDDEHDCSVVKLEGDSQTVTYCFVLKQSIEPAASATVKMSALLSEGTKVTCNAWLLDDESEIPYLAATTCIDGGLQSSNFSKKLSEVPSMEDMEKYHNLAKPLIQFMYSSSIITIDDDDEESEEDYERNIDLRRGRDKSDRYMDRPHFRRGRFPRFPRSRGQTLRPVAIGRNLFGDSGTVFRGRGRGRRFFRGFRGRGRIGNSFPKFESRYERYLKQSGNNVQGEVRPQSNYERFLHQQGIKVPQPDDVSSELNRRREHGGSAPRKRRRSSSSSSDSIDDYISRKLEQGSKKKSIERKSPSPQKLTEKHDEKAGLTVTVLTFKTEETGLLKGPNNMTILFHVNQLLMHHEAIGYVPYREIFPVEELSKHLFLGRQVRCRYVELEKDQQLPGGATFQASLVWLNVPSKSPPPLTNLSEEAMDELKFHQNQYFSGTKQSLDVVLDESNPSVVFAKVHEYISLEMAIAKRLDGAGSVLFHLDQVWIAHGDRWSLYKEEMKAPLSADYLPVGAKVSLVVKKLPASQDNSLKFQALCLWNTAECQNQGNRAFQGVPTPFVKSYGRVEYKVGLYESLKKHHDNVKKLLKLDLQNIMPVPVILNMLPEDWTATVSKALDSEFGIIQICYKQEKFVSRTLY